MLLLPFSYSLRWRIPTEKGGGERGIIRPKVVRCQGRIVRGTAPDFARDRGRRKKNEREKGREMKNERKNGKAVLGNK